MCGMVESRDGSRLSLEAIDAHRVQRELVRQQFQRDVPAERRIERAIDLAHAPSPSLATIS